MSTRWLEEVRRRHARAEAGGGEERRKRQHAEGKLSVRERIDLLLDEGTCPAIASHDENIIREALRHVREQKLPPDRFEFQMLYGIRRDLQRRLVADGYRLRLYVPYGDAWYPYFMRRLAERPANVVFLVKNLLKS